MEIHLSIGQNHCFELREALLVYRDHQSSFITRHDVLVQKSGPPTLGPAQPLSRAARSTIARSLVKSNNRTAYWLDLGNNAASGQFILGQPWNARNRRSAERLRTVNELYPEIADVKAGEDPLPSCSAVEALERQEPFINQTLAASALTMLARLLRYGKIEHHGGFFNAATGKVAALPVDPELWRKTRLRNRKMQAKLPTR